ncbi:MAG: o-succinylbenzoate synthase [Micrococcales bacterium]
MNPTLADLKATARVIELPLATKFRGLTRREMLVFEGPQGWAEWSPFVEYEPVEASVWLASAIDFAYSVQPNALRKTIQVNATLPAVAPGEVESVLARFGEFSTVKVKVGEPGQNILDDLARLIRVRIAYPEAKIRIDANGVFTVEQALALIESLDKAHIELEYFEQPCASIGELAELKVKLVGHVKIAADESVRKASDPIAVAQANAADLLVLKASPLGGVRRALAIAEQAQLPVVVSSALESSLGISQGLHLAAALPNLEYACGLATLSLFAADLVEASLKPEGGQIEVQRVAPSPKLLDTYQADEAVTEWWLERLEDSYRELHL